MVLISCNKRIIAAAVRLGISVFLLAIIILFIRYSNSIDHEFEKIFGFPLDIDYFFILSIIIPLAALVYTVFRKMFRYLNSEDVGIDANQLDAANFRSQMMDQFKTEIKEYVAQEIISIQDREGLLKAISDSVVNEAINKATVKLDLHVEKLVADNRINNINSIFAKMHERLSREVNKLYRRGNLNLLLGFFIALFGVGFLLYSMFIFRTDASISGEPPQYGGGDNLFQYFLFYIVPKLSLVVLIEVFAYFFLRLYKNSILEVKYYQNEITNVESMSIAVRLSLLTGDNDCLKDIVSRISNTERNRIYDKNQTTIELEQLRADDEHLMALLDKISQMIPGTKAS